MTSSRPPDFLCIGTQRGATSWLHRALGRHPAYWMPPFKEIDFFGPGGPGDNQRDKYLYFHHVLGDQLKTGQMDEGLLSWFSLLTLGRPRDLAWYRRLFRPAGRRLTGELSPACFLLDDAGVRRLREALPHLRIVVMLRNPVERADSQAGLMQRWGRWPEELPPEELVRRLTEAPHGGYGDYAAVVERWERIFGRDQVGIFFCDHIAARPDDALARISEFIGQRIAPGELKLDLRQRVNGAPRSVRADRVYLRLARHFLPRILPLKERFPDPVARWCRELQALAQA